MVLSIRDNPRALSESFSYDPGLRSRLNVDPVTAAMLDYLIHLQHPDALDEEGYYHFPTGYLKEGFNTDLPDERRLLKRFLKHGFISIKGKGENRWLRVNQKDIDNACVHPDRWAEFLRKQTNGGTSDE